MSVTGSKSKPQWTLSAVLWIAVLTIMASFQTWRGAYVDGILFYSLVLMLVVDRITGGRIRIVKQPIVAPKVVTLAITGTLGIVLVLAPPTQLGRFSGLYCCWCDRFTRGLGTCSAPYSTPARCLSALNVDMVHVGCRHLRLGGCGVCAQCHNAWGK